MPISRQLTYAEEMQILARSLREPMKDIAADLPFSKTALYKVRRRYPEVLAQMKKEIRDKEVEAVKAAVVADILGDAIADAVLNAFEKTYAQHDSPRE